MRSILGRRQRDWIVAAVASAVSMIVLSAQTSAFDYRNCQDFTVSAKYQIEACTRLAGDNRFIVWQAYMMRAAAFLRDGQVEDAKKDYAMAYHEIATHNNFYSSQLWYASMCWTLAILNVELDEAKGDCDEAYRLDPNNGQVLNSRAFLFLRANRLHEALFAYNEALDTNDSEFVAYDLFDNRRPYALFGRGITKVRLGDVNGGNEDIAAAEKLRPGVGVEFSLYGIKR